MLDQFNNYLSQKIISFFTYRDLKIGDKFSIQFEKESNVRNLYDALKSTGHAVQFSYENEKARYDTFALIINNIKIIVAATIDGIQPAYLTMLRNIIVTDEPQVENTALLFIHNTTLDSIIDGTEEFTKEGMPFHIKSVETDIGDKIKKSYLSKWDKEILAITLKRKKDEIFEDTSSIFDYEELLEVVNSNGIKREQYNNFGLFYDEELRELDDKSLIKDRLNDNMKLYAKVDEVHRYKDPNLDLEKDFDEKGIKLLKNEDWQEVEFEKVFKSYNDKKDEKPVEYIEENNKITEEGLIYWEKPDGNTTANKRKRNIIIFNKEKDENINIVFAFDKSLRKSQLSIDSKSDMEANTSGRRITANIRHKLNTTGFYKMSYKDGSITYQFKIAVVECNTSIFEFLKSNYSINIKSNQNLIISNTNEEEIIINSNGSIIVDKEIDTTEINIELNNDDEILKLYKNIKQYDDDVEYIKINLKYEDTLIPIGIKEEFEKPTNLSGINVWKLKRENQRNFEYKGENKIVQGTEEFFAVEEFRKNIKRESEIIECGGLYFKEVNEITKAEELDIGENLNRAYRTIIEYFRVNNLLPSLTYLNSDLNILYNKYLDEFIKCIDEFENGKPLGQNQKNLAKLGTIEKSDGYNEIIFTPLHPLNVAYQLLINNKLKNEKIPNELIRRLSPWSLLPYIYNENKRIYKPVEQTHSPEWGYYVYYKQPRYNSSKEYISKLVMEKIEEFTDHFSYFFDLSNKSPIKINLINMGDCREVMQGILKYYVKKLKDNKKIEELLPIDIYIYGDIKAQNVFEQISLYDNIKEIKETFDIKLEVDNYSEDDVLNIFRENTHFYIKNLDEENYEYSHVTFYLMDQFVEETYDNMKNISTGISLDGLMAGVPSVYIESSYRTGLGTKYINDQKNVLLELVPKLNSLVRTARNSDPFNSEQCIITAVSDTHKRSLEKIYDSAHWVTFVEPKVNLNFFKNDIEAKDLVIIHYSDQYTSSGGYDAITVTRKSKQYQAIIEEFLKNKNIENAEQCSSKVINMFNAINGDWLLRLISRKGQFPREKMSILSAVKLSLAFLYHENITWIPISLEEILRVSGGAGYKKSEGLFTAKNLTGDIKGKYCDDLLLIGIEEVDKKVKVYYYPIEVKIGENKTRTIETAIKQAKSTRKLLDDNLSNLDNTNKMNFTNKLYRNFLMQLAIVSAEKMKLYETWNEQNWDRIINSDLRRRLLNDEYEISNELDKYIGKGAVISFKSDVHSKNAKFQEDVMILQFTENAGYKNITASIEELKEKFIKGNAYIDEEVLLYYSYIKENSKTIQDDCKEIQNSVEENINSSINLKSELDKENTEGIRILIGEDLNSKEKIYWEFGNKQLNNRHILINGTSGMGKTYCIQSMLYELSIQGVSSIIFDYTDGFTEEKLEKSFKENLKEKIEQRIVYVDKFPINPFNKQLKKIGSIEVEENNVSAATRIAATFSNVYDYGDQQYSAIYQALKNGFDKYEDKMNFKVLEEELKDIEGNSATTAISKIRPFLDLDPFDFDTKYDWKEIIDAKGKVYIIQLTGFDRKAQLAITEFILWDIWNYCIKNGSEDNPIAVIIDEAQNLDHGDNSPTGKMLTEGRKFGISGWFATQFMRDQLNKGEIKRLQNAAQKLYFAPPDEERNNIAQVISDNKQDVNEWMHKLKKLNKGECVTCGNMMKKGNWVNYSAKVIKITSLEKRIQN